MFILMLIGIMKFQDRYKFNKVEILEIHLLILSLTLVNITSEPREQNLVPNILYPRKMGRNYNSEP